MSKLLIALLMSISVNASAAEIDDGQRRLMLTNELYLPMAVQSFKTLKDRNDISLRYVENFIHNGIKETLYYNKSWELYDFKVICDATENIELTCDIYMTQLDNDSFVQTLTYYEDQDSVVSTVKNTSFTRIPHKYPIYK